jgi:nondiscriminating aspartyl-tRNA synthetase
MIRRTMAAELPSAAGPTEISPVETSSSTSTTPTPTRAPAVELSGWLHRRRTLKSVTFLILRDRTGLAQAVLRAPEEIASAAGLTEETPIRLRGTPTANPQAPGGVELTGVTVRPLADPAAPPPFDLYRPGVPAALPTILDHAPVSLRHPALRVPFEITAASVHGFREALDGLHFTEVHTPKVTASATESGSNVFALDWFGGSAYLAQSPQFFKQAMVGVFERVYEVGPVFRAEPHDTSRHLAQYTSLDAELGFISGPGEVMAVLREAVAGMLTAVAERAAPALRVLDLKLPQVPDEIPSIHFAEALALLGRDAAEPDLAPSDERRLSAWALAEHGSEFLYVTGYPTAKRAFYTHPDPSRPYYSHSFDLLFRGLELVSGGQRLHRRADYESALAERGLRTEPFADYLHFFDQGLPPHGGFAIGLERWTSRLTESDNIRRTTLFPRDLHRLSP